MSFKGWWLGYDDDDDDDDDDGTSFSNQTMTPFENYPSFTSQSVF